MPARAAPTQRAIGPPPHRPAIGPPPPARKKTKKAAPVTKQPVPRGLTPIRYLHFFGVDAQNPNNWWSFTVLPGDTPPTVVGGYAQWQTVPRPLWRSLTVFQGFDPISLSISVRFLSIQAGSRLDDRAAGERVELDIARLEVMAGMGLESGAPPYVYVSTSDGSGNPTPLIPFQYQQLSNSPNVPAPFKPGYTSAPPWVITDLEWDQNPERNSLGYRVRQDGTVTVQMYGGTSPVPSTAHRRGKGTRSQAVAFTSSSRTDTALAIAAQNNSAPDRFALAQAIVKYPRNQHLRLRSIRQRIPPGTRVWVPANY